MKCDRCDAENPAGMRFCGQCGAPLVAGARPSPPAVLPGELKPVTVLFCDLVNSVPMTERLGPEAMRDLVAGFLDAALGEVRRYGGSVPQFSGDGFMALFGAPVAQEDHVRRALLAALAVRRAFAESQRNDDGRPQPQIRIGVHTGPVIFGAVGGGLGIETAIGDTANLAARLQQAAEPGAILVSESVYALAQGYARAESVGVLTLKGKSEPIAAYRLLGVSRWRSARDAVLPARLTHFVGREREISLLEEFVERAATGRGQVVAVIGEPGIGKSRLLAECRRRIDGRRTIWVEGRCLSYGAAIPYQLILDVLRSNCRIAETDSVEAIVHKVRAGLDEVGMDAARDAPVLLQLLGISGADGIAAAANPEAVKARSFEILQRFVLEGSRRRPVVLLLEDLHWIDAVSEEFLVLLARTVADARILMVATCRSEYRLPRSNLPNLTEIRLAPLSRDDSLSVVRSVMPDEGPADPVAEEIVDRADGNPLFLEQLALHASETRKRPSEPAIPQSIHGVVMARIDGLPAATKRTLQLAAVIGREFSLRLLRVVRDGQEGPEEALRQLCALEFLDEWPDDDGTNFVFRHALTQETAYQSLLARERRSYHRDVALAFEAAYSGRVAEVAELLAWHFGRSDEAERAVDYGISAAEKAQRRWANSEAQAYFDEALRRLDALPDDEPNRRRRIDAVLKQAELKLALGRHAEQAEALSKIQEIAERTGDPQRRAAWHYWTGFLQILTGGKAADAIEHCRTAAEIAAAAEFHELDGFIASCLAQAYIIAGELRAAIDQGEQALAIFEAAGNLWWASRALWHLSSAANCRGDWGASLAYCRRALDYSATLDDLRLRKAALWRTASALIQQGDADSGLQYCDAALAIKSIPFDTATARALHGYGLIKSGQIQAGIAELEEGAAWFQTSRLSHMQLLTALRLAEGYLSLNEIKRARPFAEDTLNAARKSGYAHFEALAHRLVAECLVTDDSRAAGEHIRIALQILDRIGARNDFAKALVTEAKLRRVDGGIGAARRLLTEALFIFEGLGTRDEPAAVKPMLSQLGGNPGDVPDRSASKYPLPSEEIP